MEIEYSAKKILDCQQLYLIVPCSIYGTIKPPKVSDNYTTAKNLLLEKMSKNELKLGQTIIIPDSGTVKKNYVYLCNLITLQYSHQLCSDLKIFEKCLYNMTLIPEKLGYAVGVLALHEWIQPQLIQLAMDLLQKYLGTKMKKIVFYESN